jgi:hypothetical protein
MSDIDKIKRVLMEQHGADQFNSFEFVGGPGNTLVKFDTLGDCCIALVDPACRVIWAHSLACRYEGAAAPKKYMHELFEEEEQRMVDAARVRPVTLGEVKFHLGLPPSSNPTLMAAVQKATEQPVEALAPSLASEVLAEALDALDGYRKGEQEGFITPEAMRLLTDCHGYDFKLNVRGDEALFWRGGEYICKLPYVKGCGFEISVASEFLDGERIVVQ